MHWLSFLMRCLSFGDLELQNADQKKVRASCAKASSFEASQASYAGLKIWNGPLRFSPLFWDNN
jgi:hypothetical protein